MNENKESRLPGGLILLLIYQWILAVISLGYSGAAIVGLSNFAGPPLVSLDLGLTSSGDPSVPFNYVVMWIQFLVLACWGAAMLFASLGMVRRSPRAFLLGMMCHLPLAIPALLAVLFFGHAGVSGLLSQQGAGSAWAPLMFILALMWLPFLLISGWAFFYLRRLRKSTTHR